MFITFEGCDGCGKSTQTRFAKEYLESLGREVVVTREPGGTRLAEGIRSLILDPANTDMTDRTEAMLYATARVQHMHDTVRPALDSGKIVLCDRYVDSSIAYQGVARGLGTDWVVALFELTCGVYPDLTIWLDVPSTQAFSRKGGLDKGDRIEAEGEAFHRLVYRGYREAYERYPDRIRRIDAGGTKWETRDKIRALLGDVLHV